MHTKDMVLHNELKCMTKQFYIMLIIQYTLNVP